MSLKTLTIYSLTCDSSGCRTEFQPHGRPSGGGEPLFNAARERGWDVSREHADYCPRCVALREASDGE